MANIPIIVVLVVIDVALAQIADPPVFIQHADAAGTGSCVDLDPKCSEWATQHECSINADWMLANCRKSCKSCQGDERAWSLRGQISALYDDTTSNKTFDINKVTITSLNIEHIGVDEKSQLVELTGRVVADWHDRRLIWDKTAWGVSWLNFYKKQIWVPELKQIDAPSAHPPKFQRATLAANHTGDVYMWEDFTLKAYCPFDYSKYPVDEQQCCFWLDDERYYVTRFSVSEMAQTSAQSSYQFAHSAGWQLKRVDVNENKYKVKVHQHWDRDPFDIQSSSVKICVSFKRYTGYFATELIGPTVAAAIVTLSSFLIGGFIRQLAVLIGSLIIQTLAIFSMEMKLPPASANKPPDLVRFYSINLALTCIIMVISIILYNISKITCALPPPRFVQRIIDVCGKCVPCIGDSTAENDRELVSPENQVQDKPPVKTNPWLPFISLVNMLFFVIFLVVYIFAMIACLPK